jgi:hypothetical protein
VLPNLLPEGARKREQEKRYKRYIAIGTFAIAVILCLLSLNVWSTARNADLRIKIEQQTLQSMQRGFNSIGKKVSPNLEASDITFIKNEIQKKDVTFITVLKYLSSQIPRNVYLKSIEFGGEIQPASPLLSTQKTQNTSPVQQAPQGPPATSAPEQLLKKLIDNYYPLMLKGYVFGETDNPELTLFNLILSLRQSGFIDHVDIIGKEMKQIKGKQVIEFSIFARCAKHEL